MFHDDFVPPKKIKISFVDFEIHHIGKEESEERQVNGEIDLDGHKIDLYNGLNPVETASVILHEIQHGIHHHFGFNWDASQLNPEEEMATVKGGLGWTQVLLENPDLLRYLLKIAEHKQSNK